MPTFNGETLIVTLDSGVTSVDAQDDLYEDWKDWLLTAPVNRGYPKLFDISSSQEVDAVKGLESAAYFFLRNDLGWRLRPPEEDINIYFTGNLIPRDSTIDMMVPTVGAYTVLIQGFQPIAQAITVGSGLSVGEQAKLDDLHKLQGLDASNPMTVTAASRVAGAVSQTITGDGETTTTVTRDP
jgi:hypothetical protein